MSTVSLSSAILAARTHAGLSLAGLAARVGLTRGALGHYETGAKTPPASRLADIAAATGCRIIAEPDGTWTVGPAKKISRKMSTRG